MSGMAIVTMLQGYSRQCHTIQLARRQWLIFFSSCLSVCVIELLRDVAHCLSLVLCTDSTKAVIATATTAVSSTSHMGAVFVYTSRQTTANRPACS